MHKLIFKNLLLH